MCSDLGKQRLGLGAKHLVPIILALISLGQLAEPIPGVAQFAIACNGLIDFKGMNVVVDSFDSSDPNHSYWPNYPNGRGYGVYTNTGLTANAFREAMGDVGTTQSLIGSISIGNGTIFGSVYTGTGGTVQLGYGSVGDTSWVPTFGIQPGHAFDNFCVSFPAVSLPTADWIPLNDNANITNSGYYTMNQIFGNMMITGSNVVLYVTNGIMFNAHQILIIGTNSWVTLYLGKNFSLGGVGQIINASQHAPQLIIFGLPSLTSINLYGNGAFWGVIYAPNAFAQYKGSGAPGGYYGSLICSNLTLTGNSTFSYDESLNFAVLPFPRSISIQPSKKIVPSGTPTTLTACYSYGNPVADYQWYFNQAPILDATNYFLTFNPTLTAHSGDYTVVATNIWGSYTSAPASLLVYTNAAGVLTVPSLSANTVKFQLSGVPGMNYVVQSSPNLIDWTALMTNTAPFTFIDSTTASSSQLFYRAIAQP